MAVKRARSDPTIITVISDLYLSHTFLASNEYSPATIGIHSCLVRCGDNEHFSKYFYQGIKPGHRTSEHFTAQLNDKGSKLKEDCKLNSERCAITARLRHYLHNEKSFANIIKQIENHLIQCMREDLPLPNVRSLIEFDLRCTERNQAAIRCDQAYRMRRLQFHDYDANSPINVINLKNRIDADFQLLLLNIKSNSPDREKLITNLETLIDNSFLIIQHPQPIIGTRGASYRDNVTADIDCKILCLLDRLDPQITIDNITSYVYCLTTSNRTEKSDVSYQQSEISWKRYSIVTSSNTRQIFSCANLTQIFLNQISAVPQKENPPTGKTHYGPLVYRIDFHINVTINIPNDPSPHTKSVIIRSAPFGLTTHTSQEATLFAEVFLKDLINWKQTPTVSNNASTLPPTTENIIDSVRRYFIHKTGIRPKDWVMPYIASKLRMVCNNRPESVDILCQNTLAKILAQINYMAEHPLLVLFHEDGFFLGTCDSTTVCKTLKTQYEECRRSICAIRFGAMDGMAEARDVGVRVSLIDDSFADVQYYKFDTTKLSNELGLYIIKIALCQDSRFDHILSSVAIDGNTRIHGDIRKNIYNLAELYDSEKLREICPHEEGYRSIWSNFDNKKKDKSSDCDPSCPSNSSQNSTNTTAAITHNNPAYNSNHDKQLHEHYQQLLLKQKQQYEQQILDQQHLYRLNLMEQEQYYQQSQQQYEQHLMELYAPLQSQEQQHGHFSDVTQSLYDSQNNQQYTQSTPIAIVLMPNSQFSMSDQDITELITSRLPQYSPLIQPNLIHRINIDPQQLNTSAQVLQNDLIDLESLFLDELNTNYDIRTKQSRL